MGSVFWLQIVSYAAFLFFVVMCYAKVLRYARMPVHLRWELYPIAHEKGREYGGSYFEELDWWTKRRQKSLTGELSYMAQEGLTFQQCYRRNRGLWYFTYPLHIGLLLLVIFLLLLLAGALTEIAGMPVAPPASVWGGLLYYLTPIAGAAGLILGIIGSIGLLIRRSTNKNLKFYSTPVDYLNLSFLLVVFLAGIAAWVSLDPTFSIIRSYVHSLLTFNSLSNLSPVITASIILFSLFLIYMPFSQMMHGFAKYFTYHRVRWDDEPSRINSTGESKLAELLNQPVGWSAAHIQAGKSWNELAAGVEDAGETDAK